MVETVVQLLYVAALSYISYKMNQKKVDEGSPFNERAKPATYAARGSYVPLLTGERRIGPHVCWVGNRKKIGINTFESAMHVLCVGGDVHSIRRVYQDGHPQPGSVAKAAHPSGSVIMGPFGATFTQRTHFFWGEPDQPINTFLSSATLDPPIGIASRWPHYCYVILEGVQLNGGVWPSIEYDIEVREDSPGLVNTSPYLAGTSTTLDLKRKDSIFNVTNGIAGSAKIRVNGFRGNRYPIGTRIRMVGNATPDADYTVTLVTSTSTPLPNGRTTITVAQAIAGSNSAGYIAPYLDDPNDGINIAHTFYKHLFKPWPQGLGLDQSAWSIPSLEDLGTLMESEAIATAMLIQNGEYLNTAIGQAMQDIGCMLPWDVRTGKFHFYPIRLATTRAVINEDVELPNPPEIATLHDASGTDKIIYTYPDKNHRWREGTQGEDDDGRASHANHPSTNTVPLAVVVDARTALIISTRRMAEDTGEAAAFDFEANREARLLFSGEPISVYGVPQKLRLMEKTIDVDMGAVKLRAILDAYGNETTTNPVEKTYDSGDPTDEEPDSAGGGAKMPKDAGAAQAEQLGEGLKVTDDPGLIITRIRGPEGRNTTATVYISPDDVVYTAVGTTQTYHTGGALQSDLLTSDPDDMPTGPDIEIIGPITDFEDLVMDLSSDTDGYDAGKQVLIIGNEIMCLESITLVDPTHATLNGIRRAQFGSVKANHYADEVAYIVRAKDIILLRDPLLIPGGTIYWKVVPQDDFANSVVIEDVTPAVVTFDP